MSGMWRPWSPRADPDRTENEMTSTLTELAERAELVRTRMLDTARATSMTEQEALDTVPSATIIFLTLLTDQQLPR